MSTIAEIAEAIPNLTDAELREVEQLVLESYRGRKIGLIFDDSYGTLTGEDLRAIQEQALRVIDSEPPRP